MTWIDNQGKFSLPKQNISCTHQFLEENSLPAHDNLVGPLYEQVLDRLRHRIAAGEWLSGVPLPSEVHLSHEFGVSVGTMRKALDLLVKQRVVQRKRGRGTFVKEPTAWRRTEALCFRSVDGTPLELEIDLTHHCVDVATPIEAAALMLPRVPHSSAILRITREWRAGHLLVCLEDIVLQSERFPGVASYLSKKTAPHDLYSRIYGKPVERLIWTVSQTGLSCGAQGAPDSLPSRPELQLTRVALAADDVPIELARHTVFISDHNIELAP